MNSRGKVRYKSQAVLWKSESKAQKRKQKFGDRVAAQSWRIVLNVEGPAMQNIQANQGKTTIIVNISV